jgi:hypothetical protein
MYLPVLLIRDFGGWGWVAFAVPNVAGAAAMGWVLRRPEASLQITTNHLAACAGFSWTTIAFHAFFATWLIRALAGVEGLAVLALVTAAIWVLARRDTWAMLVGGVVLVISLDVMLFLFMQNALRVPIWPVTRPADLAGLAAACFLGFLLCPYLDLTFHRVRQSTTPGEARVAFTLGFGLIFLAMILATLLYAHLLIPVLVGPVLAVLAVHLINQSGFTLAVHLRELTRRSGPLSAAGVVGCLAAGGLGLSDFASTAPDGGEMIYRLFMGFYGLVFPAYVWLCIVPDRGRERPTGRSVAMWLIAVLAAGPFYYIGFIQGRMAWVIPGVLLVLAGQIMVSRGAWDPERASG